MDFLTSEKRGQLMSRVRGRDTKPELAVRKMVRQLGYTFKTHRRSLPATPDIVFPKLRKTILVHGCFWHRHYRCKKASVPKTRALFWANKFRRNKERDRAKLRELRAQGWEALVLWECEIENPGKIRERIRQYLETA
jgi:DNA mismatch endonuclease (patch repair protein)